MPDLKVNPARLRYYRAALIRSVAPMVQSGFFTPERIQSMRTENNILLNKGLISQGQADVNRDVITAIDRVSGSLAIPLFSRRARMNLSGSLGGLFSFVGDAVNKVGSWFKGDTSDLPDIRVEFPKAEDELKDALNKITSPVIKPQLPADFLSQFEILGLPGWVIPAGLGAILLILLTRR